MARSFACSSTKRTPAFTKKEMRPNTCSISCSPRPSGPLTRSRAASSTAIALLIA